MKKYYRPLIMGLHAFGKETLIDFRGSPHTNCAATIKAFVDDLCDEISMTKYGDCHINYFGAPAVEGYSFFQLIETSNISGHLCSTDYTMINPDTGQKYNSKGNGYINIFSCKDYDEKTALRVVQQHFLPKEMKYTIIDRV
tara:strand:+ start:5213 stop:5635 length:423 start_codon:yes stop_codon:yes gene_type:complete